MPDGLRAVEALRRQRYDVVLLDVQMPVMGGLEAATRIRALPDRVKAATYSRKLLELTQGSDSARPELASARTLAQR